MMGQLAQLLCLLAGGTLVGACNLLSLQHSPASQETKVLHSPFLPELLLLFV